MKSEDADKPKLTHCKTKGEYAEAAFNVKALALEISVSTPNGENQPFDFLVTTKKGRIFKVQIKSGWKISVNGCYYVRARRSTGAYKPGDLDFLVVYIAPEDAWYVLPAKEIPPHGYPSFYPHKPGHTGKYEKFRNRWSLMTGERADDTRYLGLTIHAAADEKFSG